MADDILQEVPESEIPQVMEEMKKGWPNHFLLRQYISIMEDKKNCTTKLHQVLYRYGNLDDGVYVVYTEFPIGQEIWIYYFIYTKSENLSSLEKVMKETTTIPRDSSKCIVFEVIHENFAPIIMKCTGNEDKKYSTERCILMYFPPEENLHVKNVPEDVYVDYLTDSHVPEVDKNWTYKSPGTDIYLGLQIKNNFSLGVFRKSDKKLLSSALSLHNGGVSVLFTDPGFRGKGYAEIVVQNMIKEIRQQDRIPHCAIVEKNIPSLKLFKKIGFKECNICYYIY